MAIKGDELPKALKKLEHREQKIKAAIEQLKQEKELLRQNTIAKRLKEGKTKKLTKKEEQRIANKKINITDQDAQFMKQRSGCIKTNYNAQISVDEEDQFIVACDVTCDCNDKKQLLPMFEQSEKNLKAKVDSCKVDNGYHSAENLHEMSKNSTEIFIDDSYKQRVNNDNFKYDKVNFNYDKATDSYTCPEGKILNFLSSKNEVSTYKCSDCVECPDRLECIKKAKYKYLYRGKHEYLVEQNRAKLCSDAGRQEYQKRMHTVEPVFGNIKFNLGFRQFLVRGLSKVKGEFSLMSIAHNIKKIAKYCVSNKIKLAGCLI